MPETTVRIDRLRLRLRGVDPAAARVAASGLGPALLERLAPHLAAGSWRGATAARLELGAVVAAGNDPATLRTATVDAVAGAIVARLDSGGGGRR